MKINATDNQIFEARKFRLPIKKIDLTNPELMALGKLEIDVDWYRVYENPKAGTLYKQAQKAKNWQEKARLYSEMGHYEIVSYGTGIMGFFRKMFNIKGTIKNDILR